MIPVVVTPRSDIGKKSVLPSVLLHLPIYRVLGTFTCISHGAADAGWTSNFRMQTNIDWRDPVQLSRARLLGLYGLKAIAETIETL
jgi:hypothetical protein